MSSQAQLQDEVTAIAGSAAHTAATRGQMPQQKRGRLKWIYAFALGLFHILALAAFFCFSWKAFAAFAVLWAFGQNIGIAIGYHRLLTHRGYAVPRWLEYA